MHYHAEIILPPVSDVEAAIAQIMAPFSENANEEEQNHPFWDWYQIGGRWSGHHLIATCEPKALKAFHAALSNKKITVSGLVWGKQELSPSEQIPIVDALWREFFPDNPAKQCPIFQHYNPKNANTKGYPDVMTMRDLPQHLTCHRIIFAKPTHDDPKKMEAEYMLETETWNGVTHVDAKWDGSAAQAIAMHADQYKNCNPEFVKKVTPGPDWLLVTVDYHS